MNNEFGNVLEGAVFICFGTVLQLSAGRTDARYGNLRQDSLFQDPESSCVYPYWILVGVALSLNMDK
jgi:hypothetical protein